MRLTNIHPPSPALTALRVFGAPIAALAVLLGAHAVQSDTPTPNRVVCAERDGILDALERGYEEEPASFGLGNDGRVFEIFKSDDGATWSLVVTRADGVSCLIASGVAWEDLPQAADGPEV